MSDEALRQLVARALAEDVGPGDATSEAVVPGGARAEARIVQKAPGTVFGLDAAEEAFRQAGADGFERAGAEGRWRDGTPAEIARVTGPARALLAAERTALNLLGHLSGVATLTARFVAALEGTGTEVLDTRKTLPGLRELEKAAVRAGGGRNHRMGLHDAILIKENHAALAGGVAEAVRAARDARPDLDVEVECRDLDEVGAALAAGAERLLLDNMEPDELEAAVALRDEKPSSGTPATLEASGGITLETVRAIAETGVDFVSVGALTHSAPALDVSMLLGPDQAGHSRAGAVARQLLDAYNSHDVEKTRALIAPDGEIYGLRHAVEGTVYRGPTGVERFWSDIDEIWGGERVEDPEILERAGEALLVCDLILEGRGSGLSTARRIAVHLEVDEEGLLRRFLTLMDPEAARRDFEAGRRPEPG